MNNKTAIITGANTGMGYETARQLALAGWDVLVASRSPEKGEAAAKMINRCLPKIRQFGAGIPRCTEPFFTRQCAPVRRCVQSGA